MVLTDSSESRHNFEPNGFDAISLSGSPDSLPPSSGESRVRIRGSVSLVLCRIRLVTGVDESPRGACCSALR